MVTNKHQIIRHLHTYVHVFLNSYIRHIHKIYCSLFNVPHTWIKFTCLSDTYTSASVIHVHTVYKCPCISYIHVYIHVYIYLHACVCLYVQTKPTEHLKLSDLIRGWYRLFLCNLFIDVYFTCCCAGGSFYVMFHKS